MDQAITYLPGIDGSHIKSYFQNDPKIITEIFTLSNETLPGDLDDVRVAAEAKDIHLLRQAIHKIKPVFNIIGLLTVAQEVGRFYDLCLKASSVEEITGDYTKLWPKLINARSLVKRQTELLYATMQKTA